MRALLTTFLMFLLSACATTGGAGSSAAQHMPAIVVAKVAAADGCKNVPPELARTDESAAIALALAPALINPAIDLIGQALVNASGKNSQVVTTDVHYPTYFYNYNPSAKPSLRLATDIRCLDITTSPRGYVKNGMEGFRLRIAVLSSFDRTAFVVVPMDLEYRQALGDRADAILTAAIDFIGSDGKSIGSAVLPLNVKPRPLPYSTTDLYGTWSSWMAIPAPPDTIKSLIQSYEATAKSIATQREALNQPAAPKKGGKAPASDDAEKKLDELEDQIDPLKVQLAINTPLTMHVTLTETRTYNEFIAAVGDALVAQKSAISSAVTGELFPAQKTPAEQSTQISAVGTYWAKRYAFEKAYEAYVNAQPADKASTKAAAVAAKYDALAAAAAASVPIPDSDELKAFQN